MFVTPAPAPRTATIEPRVVYTLAAQRCGPGPKGRRISSEDARIALGAISNLYCLYALDSEDALTALVQGLVSEKIAPRQAVLGEIRRALPRIEAGAAESILAALSESLDQVFRDCGYSEARLPGFGVLRSVDPQRSSYRLHIELPLAQFLRGSHGAGPGVITLY